MSTPPFPLRRPALMRCLGAALLALVATGTQAAPPEGTFQHANSTVQLDGQPLGEGGLGSFALNNTIVYEAGTYHLWYMSAANRRLGSIQRATSTDGVNFSTQPNSALVPPANWWASPWYGLTATAEPIANFFRVSKVGADWVLMAWNPHWDAAGAYSYNTTLWSLGTDITNTALTAIGPLPRSPSGPGGRHVGPLGIVNQNLYLVQDTASGLGRYGLSAPPTTTPAGMVDAGDLYAGSPWCHSSGSGCDRSYIHNQGRTLDQGGVLGTYYAVRAYSGGARREKQIRYLESSDDGASWGPSQGVFANGDAVTVDGLPATLGFSGPEVAGTGGTYRGYFNTQDACGRLVVVTASPGASIMGPTMAKAFAPATVAVGATSTLTVTLTAPAATCSPVPTTPVYTGISYTDKLPEGLEVVSTDANTCGNASNVTTTASSFTVAGFALEAGASCTTTVTVKPTKAGVFENIIHKSPEDGDGGLSNEQGVPAVENATATLRTPGAMTVAPIPTLGQVSLGLLGLLMAGWGARSLRRRQG